MGLDEFEYGVRLLAAADTSFVCRVQIDLGAYKERHPVDTRRYPSGVPELQREASHLSVSYGKY
jgi:hypothetical protein